MWTVEYPFTTTVGRAAACIGCRVYAGAITGIECPYLMSIPMELDSAIYHIIYHLVHILIYNLEFPKHIMKVHQADKCLKTTRRTTEATTIETTLLVLPFIADTFFGDAGIDIRGVERHLLKAS